MEEHYFSIQSDQITVDKFILSDLESIHFSRSLRGKPKDIIWLLDGQGVAYEGRVDTIDKLVCGSILSTIKNYGESTHAIHLVMGLVKGNRMDMVIEKSTELGVKSIQPLLLERQVKNKLNMDRAGRIVISASKQAGRSLFPIIHEPCSLNDWLVCHENFKKILCHINASQTLADALSHEKKGVYLIIGPEGDFSEKELNCMENAKIEFAHLGPRRLRSETAAITAISNLNQLMEA